MANQNDQDLRIAVVDDSDFSRKTVVEILENEGFNVVGQASSAEEGISLGTSAGANLFIIDVIMPERSGLEMAKLMSEKGMGVHIIMMSSINMESIIIESISSGAIDFLPKPFMAEDLIKAVKKIQLERAKF
ncbi:MAG: response regulator [Bdellovibrionota bacterium]|jgi:FixJ family two-component response regulator|nr:response regulator [Bdellovibrionota bacterium]